MRDKVKMRDGDTMLIMAKDGEVVHFFAKGECPYTEACKALCGYIQVTVVKHIDPGGSGEAFSVVIAEV